MENQYFVIFPDGRIQEAAEYLKENRAEDEFRVLIEREALRKSPPVKKEKPAYLEYAQKMGFDREENSEIGFASYNFRAQLIMRLVKEYARQLVGQIGLPIYEVRGANFFNLDHPVVQAYAGLYGERLFRLAMGKKKLVMSYDASYPQFNLAGKQKLSYRQLPFGHFSIADCYRWEQSGECMLLYRQKRFFMPDLHPYFKDVAEAFDWYSRIEAQIVGAAEEVGRKYQIAAEISSPESWRQYRKEIVQIAKRQQQKILAAVLADGKDRYWIINVDYKIIDALGQSREIGCIQIDVGNAARLGIEYIDQNGQKKNPAIIHAAVPGGIERFLYLLFDQFKAAFPLWLKPAQIRLIPVNRALVDLCRQLAKNYQNQPVRIEIDNRAENVGKKIKMAYRDLVPLPVVIGEREKKEGAKELSLAVEKVLQSAKDKPFLPLGYPQELEGRLD